MVAGAKHLDLRLNKSWSQLETLKPFKLKLGGWRGPMGFIFYLGSPISVHNA